MPRVKKPFSHPGLLRADPLFRPCPAREGDEVCSIGIFLLNVTRMLEDLQSGVLTAVSTRVHIPDRETMIPVSRINEEYLPTVDLTRPILLAEINEGNYVILDGNHRFEQARRLGLEWLMANQIAGGQLIPYFTTMQGYEQFISYWNQKLEQHAEDRENRRMEPGNPC